jgi:hypothetical protein
MIQELVFHTQETIKVTGTQDLDPRFLSVNDHMSVLPHEMYVSETSETPSLILTWKPLGFLNHINCRTNNDRFPLSLWEVWFSSTFGVPILVLMFVVYYETIKREPKVLLNSVCVMLFIVTRMEVIYRPVKSSL